jgi:hypothetical protein
VKSQRRQVGARFVTRARGAFGFGGVKGTRKRARCPVRRGPNVAQHGPNLTGNAHAGHSPEAMQLTGLQESLRWGVVLPGPQAANARAAG